MTLVRWDPFRELTNFEDRWNRLFRGSVPRRSEEHLLSYGAFRRSFTLPTTVEAGKVRADYADGTLTVTLPLREEAKPKQIPVGTAA